MKKNRNVRCIGIKYSVKMKPVYFEWDRLISTLKKHLPDILEEILICDHQMHDSEQGLGQSAPAGRSKLNTNFRHDLSYTKSIYKDNPNPYFYSKEPEVSLNIMASFATVHQKCLITAITMVKSQT